MYNNDNIAAPKVPFRGFRGSKVPFRGFRGFKIFCLLFSVAGVFIFSSCNKEEGQGGSSTIRGYVYNIVHRAGSLSVDTIPAAEEKVYIVYSDKVDDPIADKRVETNQNGMYQFQYLREGNYIVCAYSNYPEELNKKKVAEWKQVKVGSGTTYADAIYIHSGKGYGLSMIKGKVMVQYLNRDGAELGKPVTAVGQRVFLKRAEEDTVFDDVRASDQGVFVFDRVPPGKYKVYTITETPEFRNRERPFYYPGVNKEADAEVIDVAKPHELYELSEVIIIVINL